MCLLLLLLSPKTLEDDTQKRYSCELKRTRSSIIFQRPMWCRSTMSAGQRSHTCSADSTSSPYGRRNLLRLSPNAASVQEQGDDDCGGVPSWKRTFRSAHHGIDIYTFFCHLCWMTEIWLKRRMKALIGAASSALSDNVSAAQGLA